MPTFLTALLVILVFYSTLHLLPASGRVSDTLVLPSGPTKLILFDSLAARRAEPLLERADAS